MEYSSCCGASRHHIWDELCAECFDHCEFEDDEDLQNKHD